MNTSSRAERIGLPSRRAFCIAVVGGGTLTLVGGCTGTPSKPRRSNRTEAPDPARALLTQTEALVARYDATIARHQGLAGRLRPLRADHTAHAAELRRMLGAHADPSQSVSPSPTGSDSVPATKAAALTALRAAETAAARKLSTAAITAKANRAALLASMGASNATHAAVLR